MKGCGALVLAFALGCATPGDRCRADPPDPASADPPGAPAPPAASNREPTMNDLRARFDELAAAWEAHRLTVIFSSNLRDYVDHPAYRGLVALGRDAVPLVVERYKAADELPWEILLQEITGERMIEDMGSYNPDEIKQKWLAWWERNRASFGR